MMGICLDTDTNTAQNMEEEENGWKRSDKSSKVFANATTSDLETYGKVKFDPPKVPVIFVLGGPGSGKVTHCDTFIEEQIGVIHINMMDLLQQYAMGNDMQDFSQLSPKTVTEVLMLEMKMAPAAKAYLISGYPRSMRDVAEYSEKIQVINGVILIAWRQSALQQQIDYGAKLGHVVLTLAKMELENFFRNVIPIVEYFDQIDMLIEVNGERTPLQVYKSFRSAVLDILGAIENQEAILNGVAGMGRGANDIPGSIVSVETAPTQEIAASALEAETKDHNFNSFATESTLRNNISRQDNSVPNTPKHDKVEVAGRETVSDIPPIIWVIGGPGSSKASLCLKAVALNPDWGHISVGRILRTITQSAPRTNADSYAVKEALAAGEMVQDKIVNSLLDLNMRQLSDRAGILVDGYPRSLQQVEYFEHKYKQQPPVILLDCSKLQLGRGRIDDTVSSFRRRLELFRELTLPMLKEMDNRKRLQIIDGDTDSPSVQGLFEKIIRDHVINLQKTTGSINREYNFASNSNSVAPPLQRIMTTIPQTDIVLHDLENNVPAAVPTIRNHVNITNGELLNLPTASNNQINNSEQRNGVGDSGKRTNFRGVLEEAERYLANSYI